MKEERGDGVNDMKNRRKGQEKPCGGLVYEQVAKLTTVPRPVPYTQHLIYGLLPLRLIADVSDGLDDGLIGDIAFDGGGTCSEVDSHFIDALQALQGLFHIGTAVVAHHAVHFEHSGFHSLIFFLWYKSHYQCINKQTS